MPNWVFNPLMENHQTQATGFKSDILQWHRPSSERVKECFDQFETKPWSSNTFSSNWMLNVNTILDRSRIYFSLSAHHLFLKDMLSESVRLIRKKGFAADFDMSLDSKSLNTNRSWNTMPLMSSIWILMTKVTIIHLSRTYDLVSFCIVFAGLSPT